MKILVMNRKYGGVFGGVELMSTSLVNEMTARGHECHILSLDQENATMCYDIDGRIQWHKIANTAADEKANWGERWRRFKKIREILVSNNIDVAIGFQDGAYLSLVTAAAGTGVSVIAAERNAPSRFDFIKAGKFKHLTFNSFRFAKRLTVQCPSYVSKYPRYLKNKIAVIPNPVFPSTEGESVKALDTGRNKIVSVGRVSFQKNYFVLIQAFSELAKNFPSWDLVIVGDGEDRGSIEAKIAKLHLSDRVSMVGYDKDPQKYYNSKDLFCLPSRWEGFPNALAEAMSKGLACVGFQGCSGVADLIENQKTGLLAAGNGDAKALSGALETLMRDDNLRIKMGQQGMKEISQYSPQKVFDMWEKLFESVSERKEKKYK
jgi:glycosyltransferase involved in cell wall biosynthesis